MQIHLEYYFKNLAIEIISKGEKKCRKFLLYLSWIPYFDFEKKKKKKDGVGGWGGGVASLVKTMACLRITFTLLLN